VGEAGELVLESEAYVGAGEGVRLLLRARGVSRDNEVSIRTSTHDQVPRREAEGSEHSFGLYSAHTDSHTHAYCEGLKGRAYRLQSPLRTK
jgi:hypothetical protein